MGRTETAASVTGPAVGDALGSQFVVPGNRDALDRRSARPGPWQWTDDAGDLAEAARSAEVAGGVAAALAATPDPPPAREFLDEVLQRTPDGRMRHDRWPARGPAHVPSAGIAVRQHNTEPPPLLEA